MPDLLDGESVEVLTAEDPQLLDRVRGEARQRALESLGLADIQRELAAVRKEKENLDKREDDLERQLLASVRGVHVSQVGGTYQPVEKLREVPFRFRAWALIYAAFEFGASREG